MTRAAQSDLTRADIGIWLINLPRSTDRRARMEAQLQGLGLLYTLYDAVDGRADWDRLTSTVDLPVFRAKIHACVEFVLEFILFPTYQILLVS